MLEDENQQWALKAVRNAERKGFLLPVWNAISTIAIVYCNKLLFDSGYVHVCILTATHQLATSLGALLRKNKSSILSKSSEVRPHRLAKLFYALLFNASIICMNFSLFHNTVHLYQIFKLVVLPVVAFLEKVLFGKRLASRQYVAVVLVIAGSLMVILVDSRYVDDHGSATRALGDVNILGLLAGSLAVLASSLQGVYLKYLQQKFPDYGDLLLSLSWYCAILGGLVAPVLDSYFAGIRFTRFARSLFGFAHLSSHSITYLMLSLFCAVSVNMSQFMLIERFSALAFQVLGQVKMIGLVLLGCLLFDEKMDTIKSIGVCFGTCGSWLYTTSIHLPTLHHRPCISAIVVGIALILVSAQYYFTISTRSALVV